MTGILPPRPAPKRIGVTVLTLRIEFVFLLDILRLGYSMFTSPWAQKGTIKWTSDGNHLSGPLLRASSESVLRSLGESLPHYPEDSFVDAALVPSVPFGLDLLAGSYFRPTDTSIATESPYSTCDASTPPPSSPVRQTIASIDPGHRHPALHDGGMGWNGALPIPQIFAGPCPGPELFPELPDAFPSTGGPDLPQTVPLHAFDSLSPGYAMREGSKPFLAHSPRAFDNAPLHGHFHWPTHRAADPHPDQHSPVPTHDDSPHAIPPSLAADDHGADALDAATTRYDHQKPKAPRKLLVATTRRQEASKSRRSTTSAAVYVCPFAPHCNSTFTRQFSLANHIRSHKNAREFTCPVEGCDKRFNTAALCSSHAKRCH
ncbi:hypothetical protein EV121DRAFT_292075 [Schizophyllum commune]